MADRIEHPDEERAIEVLRRAADDRENNAGVFRSDAISGAAKADADLLRAVADELPTLRQQLTEAQADRDDGVALIRAERHRQMTAEGWTSEHDDGHRYGEMAITAACYAANGTDAQVVCQGEDAFQWGTCDDKRKKHDRQRQLVIAGALIAAEIDRLRRAAPDPVHQEPADG